MGGGDTPEQLPTAQEKEALKIQEEKWARYEELKPLREGFMQKVTGYQVGEDGGLQIVEGGILNADGSVKTDGSAAIQATNKAFTPRNINPNGGSYRGGLVDLEVNKMQSQSEGVAGLKLAQQNQALKGLEQATAMARGDAAEATQGMHELAANANRKAQNDANNAFANKSANRNLAGQVVGAGLGYGMHEEKLPGQKNGYKGLRGLM